MRQFLCKPNAEASSLDYAEAKQKIAQNFSNFAAIAQLVEHNLAKVRVASSSLVCRSKDKATTSVAFFVIFHNTITRTRDPKK